MFEKFLRAGAADFRQRYEGTFGFFRNQDGKKMLVQLTQVREDQCNFIGDNGQDYLIKPDAPGEIGFEFAPPKAAFYNGDKRAILVERIAARQFQRGISSRNTQIAQLRPTGGWDALPINFETLQKIFMKAVAPKDAFAAWATRESIALSPQFAVSIRTANAYVFDKKIGTYQRTDRHFAFKLDEPDLWRVELVDTLKALDCTAEVA
jgi:hypothetical protein